MHWRIESRRLWPVRGRSVDSLRDFAPKPRQEAAFPLLWSFVGLGTRELPSGPSEEQPSAGACRKMLVKSQFFYVLQLSRSVHSGIMLENVSTYYIGFNSRAVCTWKCLASADLKFVLHIAVLQDH